jgi:hypothetical protein
VLADWFGNADFDLKLMAVRMAEHLKWSWGVEGQPAKPRDDLLR